MKRCKNTQQVQGSPIKVVDDRLTAPVTSLLKSVFIERLVAAFPNIKKQEVKLTLSSVAPPSDLAAALASKGAKTKGNSKEPTAVIQDHASKWIPQDGSFYDRILQVGSIAPREL